MTELVEIDEWQGHADTTTIEHLLAPMRDALSDPLVVEICINRPGEMFVEHLKNGWSRHERAGLSFEDLESLGSAVANYSRQEFSSAKPLMAAALPTGERCQFVLAPATERKHCIVCIRKPSLDVGSIDAFAEQGLFDAVRIDGSSINGDEHELLKLKRAGKIADFLKLAVLTRQTIVFSGATGSGKTRALKAFAQQIPSSERLITIEDVRETFLPGHENRVHLLYSKGNQGIANVSAKLLLHASLRLRPDRILMAELRGEEAFDFIRNAASGHPGSMTSAHGASPDLVFEQIGLMVRESEGGRDLPREDIQRLLRLVVNIVVQFERVGNRRFVSDIYYEPETRLRAAEAAKL